MAASKVAQIEPPVTPAFPTPLAVEAPCPPRLTSFTANVLKLVSGSTTAQLITILTAPFLARLFAPEAFGAAALFAALAGLVSTVVGMRYELSIVLPEKDEEAAETAMLSLSFIVITSSLSVPFILLFGNRLLILLRATELHTVLWLAPFYMLLNGIFSTLVFWNIRKREFGIQGVAQVAGVVFFVAGQLVAGLYGYRSGKTIILATVFSAFVTAVILGIRVWQGSGRLFMQVTYQGMLRAMKRYSSFPKYSTGTAVLNNLGWQVPTFLLSAFFSTEVVGYYALGNKLLRLPVSLIGSNIANVFFQHASEANRKGSLHESVDTMFRYLVKLFLFPSLLLTMIGKDLFVVVFGYKWAEAGVFSQILSVYVLFWFLAVPLGIALNVLEKQAVELRLVIIVLVARVIALIVGGSTGNPNWALALFALAGVLTYGYYFVVVFRTCAIPHKRIVTIISRELGLFIPAGVLLGFFMWWHASPLIILVLSAFMLVLYYLQWARSDPLVRVALDEWWKTRASVKIRQRS